MNFARHAADKSGKRVGFSLTTNGTITHSSAWEVLMTKDLELAVSFDGTMAMHDRHRRDVRGHGTASRVEATLLRLIERRRPFRVVVVVRPDNLEEVSAGLQHLRDLGVRAVDLSLDLWTAWSTGDGVRLRELVNYAAKLWRQWLPEFSVNWFDSKVGQLARIPASQESSRCGFGAGEIAVAPSGRLYPCERVVGEDRPDHPLRLPGHVLEGKDFLQYGPSPFERCSPCSQCVLVPMCDTTCRCSNFIRTGDPNRPDGLLCLLNKAVAEAVSDVVGKAHSTDSSPHTKTQSKRPCYV